MITERPKRKRLDFDICKCRTLSNLHDSLTGNYMGSSVASHMYPCGLAASTFKSVVRTFLESLEHPCDSGGRSTGLLSPTPDAAEPMLICIWCIVRSHGFRFLRGTHYLVTGTPRTLWSTTTCCIVQMQDLDANRRKGLFLAVDRRTVFKASDWSDHDFVPILS